MLQGLYVKDFILIEELELDFSEGLSVITGNTGAGKSILLDAVLFCLGQSFSGNPIRPGTDSCSVSCIFTANSAINLFLDEHDIETDEQLIIKRTQNNKSRKKIFINGQIVATKIVQTLFDFLIEMHGQHNHTLLLNKNAHLKILDEYGQCTALKTQVSEYYDKWQELVRKKAEIERNRLSIQEEKEYLEHICKELSSAEITAEEEQELAEIKRNLQNKDKEQKLLKDVLFEIENSAFSQIIARSQNAISRANGDEFLEQANTELELAYDKIENAKSLLNQSLSKYENSEYSLEEIDDRLYYIRDLARKNSVQPSELPEFLLKSERRLAELDSIIDEGSNIDKSLDLAKQEYLQHAQQLSKLRLTAADDIKHKTMAELMKLEMPKAIFEVKIDSGENFASANGIDKVSFIAATNPGMGLSPIDEIASGGELSRFMLAFRLVLQNSAPKNTIIFDEIDVGISGSVAESIGKRLSALGKSVQTIVITHQPQVAGKADSHILVEKIQEEDRTYVKVSKLGGDDRSLELARMISGSQITQTGINAAKELIT